MSSHASSMHSPFTRERACTLVDTFRVPSFQPFISSNGHFQSILSHLYPPPPKLSYKRVSIRTDDGLDEVAIDIAGGSSLAPEDDDHPKPVALILHGLESSSTGVVTLRIADALLAAGFKVLAMNYRSCAADAGPPTSIRLYHAGFIDDVKTVLTATRAAAESLGKQPRPIFIVGFSLGANVLCNLLRDAGEEAFEKYRIVSAFGICVPFDPGHCQKTIDYGFRQVLYSSRLVSSMKNRFEAALRTGVDVGEIDVNAVRSAATIGDIDDSIIAPTFGFNDRYDYYRKVDARLCLKHISVPTFLINARNDPFFGHDGGKGLPAKEHLTDSPVRLLVTESGGHCGYLDYNGFTQNQRMYLARLCSSFCSFIYKSLDP